MQAAAPRPVCRDGQRLFAGSAGTQKTARRHSQHRHGRLQGQRTDARSVQTLPAARLEFHRSEERRVGKEGRYRWAPDYLKKKKKKNKQTRMKRGRSEEMGKRPAHDR